MTSDNLTLRRIHYTVGLFLSAAFLMTSNSLKGQDTLVGLDSLWIYYDSVGGPPDQGSLSWYDLNYDDSEWKTGYAQLGYGENDENTKIDSINVIDGMVEPMITAYFRDTFTLTDAGIYDSLRLKLIYDNGALVHINGNEVWRVNMPTGPVTYNTTAYGSGENVEAIVDIENVLINGLNIVAVEMHQSSVTSDDLSFNFELVGLPPEPNEFITFIDTGWYYFDAEMEPPVQGMTTWWAVGYDHSTWGNGQAQLGYGDGDEKTTINSNTETAYFRKHFNVDDAAKYDSTLLQLLVDDGAVVYVNGQEVWRENMPAGVIEYSTTAIEIYENTLVDTFLVGGLVTGVNTIAVEIHQRGSGSSDISFDFYMRGIEGDGCTVGGPCDDGDICTTNDMYDASCNCVGTPITSSGDHLVLTAADSPLSETYKANIEISTTSGDAIQAEVEKLTTLIAPMVSLNPLFEVPLTAELMIMQMGCDFLEKSSR